MKGGGWVGSGGGLGCVLVRGGVGWWDGVGLVVVLGEGGGVDSVLVRGGVGDGVFGGW